MEIRTLNIHDYPQVNTIYLEGIAGGNATFQTEGKRWDEWNLSHLENCRLVAVENNKIMGWAALSPVSSRFVYSGVSEVSIYIATAAQGRKIGNSLLRALINASEDAGIWTLQAGIFPENKATLALHDRCGFRIVGLRKRIGKMHTGIWRDTILLERRSATIGL